MNAKQATVASVYAGGYLDVMIPGKSAGVRVTAGRELAGAAIGDQVLLGEEGGRYWAITLLGVAPPPPPPPPPVDGGGQEKPPEEQETITGSTACPVSWSGTYRNGSWRGDTQDLYAGDWSGTGINRGAAFYGRKPATLGTLTAGRVRIEREAGGTFGAQTLTMLLLAGGTRPSGFPTVINSTGGPSLPVGGKTNWAIPGSWLAQFESGEAGGIGIGNGNVTPYIHVSGGRMVATFNWERTS